MSGLAGSSKDNPWRMDARGRLSLESASFFLFLFFPSADLCFVLALFSESRRDHGAHEHL
jgi:hypothetical protein